MTAAALYIRTTAVDGSGDGTVDVDSGSGTAYAYKSMALFDAGAAASLTQNMVVTCYGNSSNKDTTQVDYTSPWGTSTYTLTIKNHPDQITNGVWNDNYYIYSRQADYSYGIRFNVNAISRFYLQGLQLEITTANSTIIHLLSRTWILGNILRATGAGSNKKAIDMRSVGRFVVTNNVFYDFNEYAIRGGMTFSSGYYAALYNNTICDSLKAIHLDISGAGVYAKNNLMQGVSTTLWVQDATPNATSATNITEDATSPQGASYRNIAVTFTDETGNNFASADAAVVGVGTDLRTDADGKYSFTTDILGVDRPAAAWDIGAFQKVAAAGNPYHYRMNQ